MLTVWKASHLSISPLEMHTQHSATDEARSVISLRTARQCTRVDMEAILTVAREKSFPVTDFDKLIRRIPSSFQPKCGNEAGMAWTELFSAIILALFPLFCYPYIVLQLNKPLKTSFLIPSPFILGMRQGQPEFSLIPRSCGRESGLVLTACARVDPSLCILGMRLGWPGFSLTPRLCGRESGLILTACACVPIPRKTRESVYICKQLVCICLTPIYHQKAAN